MKNLYLAVWIACLISSFLDYETSSMTSTKDCEMAADKSFFFGLVFYAISLVQKDFTGGFSGIDIILVIHRDDSL